MSIIEVKEYFAKFGIADRIQEFEISSATVEDAAIAFNCESKLIAKSLAFMLKEQCILIVVAGDAKVDNRKYKNYFGVKAKMLNPEQTISLIGHAVGGVCPFGIKSNINVYLDLSLKRFEYVFPACGNSNSGIKLSLFELEKYSNCINWVDVCKNWE